MSINPKKCETAINSNILLFNSFLSLLFDIEFSKHSDLVKANIIAKPSYTHLIQN